MARSDSLTLPLSATGKMIRIRNYISCLAILAALMSAAPSAAQQELVTVTLQPGNTNWQWQSYAESITALFANSIQSRVSQGIESREFVADTAAAVLVFNIRIGQNGELKHFSPITPKGRYHAYLIRRTARRVQPFRATPRALPVFYFDGTITFECRFQPTRWYKKLYFEQPLDSLELPAFVPLIKTVRVMDPALPTYEPLIKDKPQLLTDFKRRIGVTVEIADTSSYTALDVAGRVFFIHVPFDSLGVEPMSELLLRTRLERALVKAGARITAEDYDPGVALLALERQTAEKDSIEQLSATVDSIEQLSAAVDSIEQLSATEDSIEQPSIAVDSLAVPDSIAVPAEEQEQTDSTETPADTETTWELPPGRDLGEAFSSVFNSEFLVLSAGLARDSTGDSAVCHVRLYLSEHPDQLKRKFSYRFSHGGSLPDSLGIMLVQRLTAPPAKPAPPPKPTPKVTATPADSSAEADTTAPADTINAADTTAPDSISAAPAVTPPVAGPDSSSAAAPATDSSSAVPAIADTSAGAAQQDSSQIENKPPPEAAPADSAAPEESPATQPDTAATDTP